MCLLQAREQGSAVHEGGELPEDVPPRSSALMGEESRGQLEGAGAFVIFKIGILFVSGGEETADGGDFEAVPRDRSGHGALGCVGKKMLVQGPLSKESRRWCGKKA